MPSILPVVINSSMFPSLTICPKNFICCSLIPFSNSFSTPTDLNTSSLLFLSVNDINTAINADLKALRGWLEGKKLSLNVVKTQGMIIGSRCKFHSKDLPSSSKPDLNIGSKEITMFNNKYLGTQVVDQLEMV